MRLNSLLIGVLCGVVVACGPQPTDPVVCPSLNGPSDGLAKAGASLGMDDTTTDLLNSVAFVSHSFVVRPKSQVTLSLSLDSSALGPLLFVYGPRSATGQFGPCRVESAQGQAGRPLVVVLDIHEAEAGEYRVLVGGRPVLQSKGNYSLTLECTGPGCSESGCELLPQACANKTCPNGFETDENGCATCECVPVDCGPFKTLINGECRCNCPPMKAPVCGDDGLTYENTCQATCKGVSVAFDKKCEDQCEILSPTDCPNACANGYVTKDGCVTCECKSDPCLGVDSTYAPVCGTDGLSYTNRLSAECAGQGVAYLGQCLAYCSLPTGCVLDCPYGLRPKLGLGSHCFECECMVEPSDAKPFWCARRGVATITTQPAGGNNPTPGNSQTTVPVSLPGADELQLTEKTLGLVTHMAHARTFSSKEVGKDYNWSPVSFGACPTGLCQDDSDCNTARAYVEAAVSVTGDGPSLEPLDANAWVLKCVKSSQIAINQNVLGTCRLITPPSCSPQVVPASPDNNSQNQTCNNDKQLCALTPDGPTCRPADACGCLTKLAGKTYSPVCTAGPDGTEQEYFNECLALCAGAGAVVRPGKCCDGNPLPNGDVLEGFESLQLDYCDQTPGASVHFTVGNACPPEPTACEAEDGGEFSTCCLVPNMPVSP